MYDARVDILPAPDVRVQVLHRQNLVSLSSDGANLVRVVVPGPPGPRGPPGPGGSFSDAVAVAVAVVGGFRVVMDDGNGVRYADAWQSGDLETLVGVSLNSALAGELVTIRQFGEVEHAGWNFSIGDPVFLGASGHLVQPPPGGALASVRVGVALAPTRLRVSVQPPIYRAE